jgi:hypothetical protein
LEQGEQLLGAAARVGTATQPILLFYGLSQMGRAIAAASPLLSQKEYTLVGHGLIDGELQGAATQGLARLKIRRDEKGAFPTVAKAIAASSLEVPVPLGDLWGLLPYAEKFPLPGSGNLTRLTWFPNLNPGVHSPGLELFELQGLPLRLHLAVPDPNIVDPEVIDEEKRLLDEFLGAYPALKGWSLQGHFQRVPYIPLADGSSLALRLALPLAQADGGIGPDRTPAYHGAFYVYPVIDGTDLPAHPFLIWWAVLYPLSRLARYYPNVWAKLTAISSSPEAAPIEFVLREALRAVPELALRAIRRFA